MLDRPQWRTVSRRSREYVRRLVASLPAGRTTIRLNTRVTRVLRCPGGGVDIVDASGATGHFDDVVFGAHPAEVLEMLGAGASADETAILSRFAYKTSTAYLHSDAALMPARRSCWTSWNYIGKGAAGGTSTVLDPADAEPCCVTYWLNRLQNLPPTMPELFVTLNPAVPPAAGLQLRTFTYSHPQYTPASVAAQADVASRLQGSRGTWFAGAYLGYGFHEDAITAGLRVAHAMTGHAPAWWSRELHTPARIFAAPSRSISSTAESETPQARLERLLQLRASGGPYWVDNLGNGGPVGAATEIVRAAMLASDSNAAQAAAPPSLGVSEGGDMAGRIVEYPGDVLFSSRLLLGEESSASSAVGQRTKGKHGSVVADDDGAASDGSTQSSSVGDGAGSASASASGLSSRGLTALQLSPDSSSAGSRSDDSSAFLRKTPLPTSAVLGLARRAFKSDAVKSVAAAAASAGGHASAMTRSAADAGGRGGYTSRVSDLYAADVFQSASAWLWHATRTAALSVAATPVLGFLERSVKVGCLLLRLPDGTERIFGDASALGVLRARMRVHSWNFFARAAAEADLGLARAFMAGEWTTDDLTAVFHIFSVNRERAALKPYGMWTTWLGATANYLSFTLQMDNSLAGSRKNIHAHYDLSNDLFVGFLDPVTLMYSCGFFRATPRALRDADSSPHPVVGGAVVGGGAVAAAAADTDVAFEGSLAEAQLRKLDHLIARANVQPGDRVLDLGFGWGGLAIRLAETVGCRVHGITLSKEQLALASERVRARGLEHLITFEIIDYRDFAAAHPGEFDRIISVEMVEAVGHNYFPTFMGALDRLLAPNGVLVLQAITLPEPRYAAYLRSADFINTIIFPGGCCASITALLDASASAGAKLVLQSTDDFGLHYGETLRRWRANFNAGLDAVVRPLGFDDTFIRTWNYYLCYCEAGFSSQTLGLHVLTFARPGTAALWQGKRHGRLAQPLAA